MREPQCLFHKVFDRQNQDAVRPQCRDESQLNRSPGPATKRMKVPPKSAIADNNLDHPAVDAAIEVDPRNRPPDKAVNADPQKGQQAPVHVANQPMRIGSSASA
jgi:hypothetical protein